MLRVCWAEKDTLFEVIVPLHESCVPKRHVMALLVSHAVSAHELKTRTWMQQSAHSFVHLHVLSVRGGRYYRGVGDFLVSAKSLNQSL